VGISLIGSRCDCSSVPSGTETGNPEVALLRQKISRLRQTMKSQNTQSNNSIIKKMERLDDFLIVKVYYPGFKNYEGLKILVYENVTSSQIRTASILDPHFCSNKKHISPIARFEPTPRGWRMAKIFCKNFI